MSCKGSPRESPGLMVHRHGWDMLKLIQLLVDFDDIFSFGLRFPACHTMRQSKQRQRQGLRSFCSRASCMRSTSFCSAAASSSTSQQIPLSTRALESVAGLLDVILWRSLVPISLAFEGCA